MALFKTKKEVKKVDRKSDVKDVKEVSAAKIAHLAADFTSVLISPRITEKASMLAQIEKAPVYTFDVHPSATKISIAKAIQDVYNVKPLKIRVVQVPEKKVFSRGRAGVKKGGKKAYVYLKAGEKIEIV